MPDPAPLPPAGPDYFSATFHVTPALMALARLSDGRIIETNTAFLRAAGYTHRDEVIGHSSFDLGIWARPQERNMLVALLRQHGQVRDFEAVFLTKQREVRYVLLNADTFTHAGEACMLITAFDLSERKRREQLQNATYQISRVLVSGGDLGTLFAEVHRIIEGLMPARNFYVAQQREDDGRIEFPYFVDQIIPSVPARPPANGLTEHVLRTGEPMLIKGADLPDLLTPFAPYTPPGPVAAVRLAAPLLIGGRAFGVLAVQDYENPEAYGEEEKRLLVFVADQAASAVHRRLTEARQRESEQFFAKSLQATPALVIVARLENGVILEVNAAMERTSGFSREEMIGHSTLELGFWVEPERRDAFIAQMRRDGRVRDFEGDFRIKHGGIIPLLLNADVIEMNGIKCMLTIGVDITSRREAARALQLAKEASDAANRAKSQFLASMSHELRTPLNGILGYTQILGRDETLTPKQREGLEVIQQSAEHLFGLINDVLDLARIEAGKLELHPVDFNLPEFAHTMFEFFAPRAREKNLWFESNIQPGLPQVIRGDLQRLRQVVFNLLGNAIKFTTEGGVIFSVERVDGRIRFSVSDTGPGITPEDQARLFVPFTQVGDQNQRRGGTGLGLSVSRNIVEQMGGRLQLESRAGWGSRFWFEIPPGELTGVAPVLQPAANPRRVTGYAGPRLRVLVADDHAPNCAVLVDFLRPLGFEVLTAADGVEALEIACRDRPDLVLMDVRMPRLDGLEATKSIRKAYPENPPCIIAVSASTHEGQQQAALAAGCAAFLSKPFYEDALLTLLGTHLGVVWHHAPPPPSSGSRNPITGLEVPPDSVDARAIAELAAKGDVLGIRTYVQQLQRRDPFQAPFAEHIMELASGFRLKAIRTFVAPFCR
jgi:PAS domain S-box-containing protein